MTRKTLAVQVTEDILSKIESQSLSPGAPIPSETEIAKELGVSRGIVREAYHSLTAAGVIVVSSGRRPRVGKLKSRVLESFFSHAQMTGQIDIINLMTLRQAIEVAAAGMAAENRSYLNLHDMKTALGKMRENIENTNSYVGYDFNFHLSILEASGNILFELIFKGLRETVHAAMTAGINDRDSVDRKDTIYKLHNHVFQAIEKSNAEAAEEAMRNHFEVAINYITPT
jgi:GntR family transcriptional repressor for pyruvate dehydrogenase complex